MCVVRRYEASNLDETLDILKVYMFIIHFDFKSFQDSIKLGWFLTD